MRTSATKSGWTTVSNVAVVEYDDDDIPNPLTAADYGLDQERFEYLTEKKPWLLERYKELREVQAEIDRGPRLFARRKELFLELMAEGEQQSTIARAINRSPMAVSFAIEAQPSRRRKPDDK